jgi:hypothetical protein
MDRKALSAHLAGCEASEMMAYADLGDQGTVVVAPDGKKFRYSNEQLEKVELKLKPKPKPRKKSTKPTEKPATKKSTKPSSRKGTNASTKPESKP